MLKSYVCQRFPGFSIRSSGKSAEFRDGYFETDNLEIQALVESNEYYGIHIRDREAVEAEAVAGAKAEVPGAGKPAQTFGGIQNAGGTGANTIKVQGKEKAEELKALYGEPINVAGNWYTFDTSKKGGPSD